MIGNHVPAIECLPLIIDKERQLMFLRLGFSQMVAQKIVEFQGIDSPWTLACHSDDVSAICAVIRRSGILVSGGTSDRRAQIPILAAKNLNLPMLLFKMMEHSTKPYNMKCVNSRQVLAYHQR